MKKAIATFVLLLAGTPLFAQEQTLFNGGIESGGYGGAVVKATAINDQAALLVGGGGAWLIDHRFSIGGAAYGLANNVTTRGFGPDTTRIDMGYGGLVLGYRLNPDDVVHVGVQTLVGAGGVDHRTRYYNGSGWHGESGSSFGNGDAFFVVEPGINVELNLTRSMRVNLEGSYRYVNGIDLKGVTDADMSGPAAALTFNFGSF